MARIITFLLLLSFAVLSIIAAPAADAIANRQTTRSRVVRQLQRPRPRQAEASPLPTPPDILFRLRVPLDSPVTARRGYYFSSPGTGGKYVTATSTTVADATIYRLKGTTGRFQTQADTTAFAYSNLIANAASLIPISTPNPASLSSIGFLTCNIIGTSFQCTDPSGGGRAFGLSPANSNQLLFTATPATQPVYPVIVELVG